MNIYVMLLHFQQGSAFAAERSKIMVSVTERVDSR
jgi:hypothetical protein